MLHGPENGTFMATCETCTTSVAHHTDVREVAVLRLVRDGWRTSMASQQTWCPECAVPSPTTPPKE